MSEENRHPKVRNRRLHLANERTFLAWVRTSISIMAFGFVMERFSLFISQLSCLLGHKETTQSITPGGPHLSSVLGIILIAFGALMGFLALIRYKKIEKQIDDDTYRPSFVLDFLLAICLLVVGLFFVFYFIQSL